MEHSLRPVATRNAIAIQQFQEWNGYAAAGAQLTTNFAGAGCTLPLQKRGNSLCCTTECLNGNDQFLVYLNYLASPYQEV